MKYGLHIEMFSLMHHVVSFTTLVVDAFVVYGLVHLSSSLLDVLESASTLSLFDIVHFRCTSSLHLVVAVICPVHYLLIEHFHLRLY